VNLVPVFMHHFSMVNFFFFLHLWWTQRLQEMILFTPKWPSSCSHGWRVDQPGWTDLICQVSLQLSPSFFMR
jgi:hypothetical protein